MLTCTTREPDQFAGSIHEQEARELPSCPYCGSDVGQENERCSDCLNECEEEATLAANEADYGASDAAAVEDFYTAEQKRRLRAYSAMCAAIHHHHLIWNRLYQGAATIPPSEYGPRAARILNRCGEVVTLIQRLAVASVEGK